MLITLGLNYCQVIMMLGFYFLTTPDLRAITLVVTNLLGCCQRQQTTQNEQHHSVPIKI